MSRPLLALLLAVCGGLLLHEGWRAAHSLAGNMDFYGKDIAYKIAGLSEAGFPENDFS